MTAPADHLFDKMQALMGKHRDASIVHDSAEPAAGAAHQAGAPAANAAQAFDPPFPVLTDIVRRGEIVADEQRPSALASPTPEMPAAYATAAQARALAAAVALQVQDMLDEHLAYQVETVVAPRLRQAMDDTLSTLFIQLALDTESIVRDAVARELARHGIHAPDTPENPGNPV